MRSDRDLALIVIRLADNKAYDTALDLAREPCYIITVIFSCTGILHHFACYRRSDDLAVKKIFKPRKHAALKRHAGT